MLKRQRKVTKDEIAKELSKLVWDFQSLAGYASMEFSDFRDAINIARGIALGRNDA